MEVCVCGCVCFSHGKNTHAHAPGAKKTPWAKLAKNDPQTTQIITKFNPFLAPPQNQIFCTCLSQTRGKSGLSLFTCVLDLITIYVGKVDYHYLHVFWTLSLFTWEKWIITIYTCFGPYHCLRTASSRWKCVCVCVWVCLRTASSRWKCVCVGVSAHRE